ncbi:MAG TPA: chemotaxis protein CheW [Gammaproteobacteria bacterium]|jgi:twitching motility protein PilI
MATKKTLDPVAFLQEIEDLCRSSAIGMPRKAGNSAEWSGITFRIGDNHLVSQLGEVVEILEYPDLSNVPLARPWVRGIANVRGNLLPVVDMNGFLNGNAATITPRTRVLVVDHKGMYTGLIVDEVLGLKHFTDDEYTGDLPEMDEAFEPYIQNGFRRDDRVWSIFSMHAMAETPQFLQAAV